MDFIKEISDNINKDIEKLYSRPLPASRTGALYSAFSYPTKISPESIAVFIASHTKPGDTILDTFGGSGTTGLATHLCSDPTDEVIEIAKKMNANPVWGPRNAIIYELSTLGSFVAETMCSKTDSRKFIDAAYDLITSTEQELGNIYATIDDTGKTGIIRYSIWSDLLKCGNCGHEISFWDACVNIEPLSLKQQFQCPICNIIKEASSVERVFEEYIDKLTGEKEIKKKSILCRIYGQTGKRKWARDANEHDSIFNKQIESVEWTTSVPIAEMPWGDLHRAGYHKGITHAHHFYTSRNLFVISRLWDNVKKYPIEIQNALKLLILSYNASHSTLMTRVVVKSNEKDFVITGAQPGVLYISSLPVEKNVFEGVKRKAKTLAKAFEIVESSTSKVTVVNKSSTKLDVPDNTIDYVFTDPPFGDYIPYSEINFLNEIWLGKVTDNKEEIIISTSQNKTQMQYKVMMKQVFKEINRTLKEDGLATIVFHSAKAEVWSALQDSYREADLRIVTSSVLDKLQGSFKQVTAQVTVKGDPLLLLEKVNNQLVSNDNSLDVDKVIVFLLEQASDASDAKELTVERLYSRFVTLYLENNLKVPFDASDFYNRVKVISEGLRCQITELL